MTAIPIMMIENKTITVIFPDVNPSELPGPDPKVISPLSGEEPKDLQVKVCDEEVPSKTGVAVLQEQRAPVFDAGDEIQNWSEWIDIISLNFVKLTSGKLIEADLGNTT